MRPEATEPFDSPLEEVLARMPEEESPADLEERCLIAIRDLDSRTRQAMRSTAAQRRTNWKPLVLAAAAGLVISFVGLTTLLPNLMPAKRAMMAPSTGAAYERASGPRDGPAAGGEFAGQALPASPPAQGSTAAPTAGTVVRSGGKPAAAPPGAGEERTAGSQSADHHTKALGARLTPVPPPPPTLRYPPPAEAGPERPWYDTSSDRQKIVHTLLSLLVRDVQEAYDRSKSIIEEAKGFIEQDDLRLEKGGRREAHLGARVPTDKLKGVVAQLRDLGEVKLLKTETEDATREYRAQGAEIRDLGATEDELVRKYEAEKDPRTKRMLHEQIQDLRARNQASKGSLSQLSEQTHLSFLELTLTEKTTPLKFLSSARGHLGAALGWLAVTAFLWLPLLVVVLVLWRRGGRGSA